jgi:hypothetical protein
MNFVLSIVMVTVFAVLAAAQVAAPEVEIQALQPRRAAADNQTRWDEGEVHFLRADVAVVDGFYTLPDRRRGPYTLVITREGSRWLIAAARAGTAVQPAG